MNELEIPKSEQEYDSRREEEGWLQRADAVHVAKNQLLESIRDLYPGESAAAKAARCLCLVEHMNILFQSLEMEYGDTIPYMVVRDIIEEVFKLSNRNGNIQ